MRRACLPLAVLSVCFACTVEEGRTDGTFTTFDPTTTGDGDGDGDGDNETGDTGMSTGDGDGDGDTGSAECGNGMVEGNEECDLGPDNSETGQCTPNCLIAACGDGYVYEGVEECDDGNPDNTDACTTECNNAVCGDGYVQEGVEPCDDGNDDDTDGCNTSCELGSCGDGIVQGDEECDDGNEIISDACLDNCLNATCGDGYVWVGMEDCDDGGESAECDADCTVVECGDMVVNATASEECDDGNADNTDDCTEQCLLPACGDGFLQMGEVCDTDDFGDETCMSQGFTTGDLICTDMCELDTSDCTNSPCPGGGAFVNNFCWYPSQVCETTATKCQSVGLTGSGGYVNSVWDMPTMTEIANQLGLAAGGDVGCCVQFGWIDNGTIYTHNFGNQFYNWDNCYSNFPTLKACNPP
jgi:cysteine-rich repeat protein